MVCYRFFLDENQNLNRIIICCASVQAGSVVHTSIYLLSGTCYAGQLRALNTAVTVWCVYMLSDATACRKHAQQCHVSVVVSAVKEKVSRSSGEWGSP